MPGRSDIAKQDALRERTLPQTSREIIVTNADVVAALAALGVKIDATNTALATANGHLANIKTNTDRIP